jgi:hypothetical protein
MTNSFAEYTFSLNGETSETEPRAFFEIFSGTDNLRSSLTFSYPVDGDGASAFGKIYKQ